MHRRYYVAILLSAIVSTALSAQIELPADFSARLDEMGLEFIYPVEADFKEQRQVKNEFIAYDFGLRSRKEGLEIRYDLQTDEELGDLAGNPHVATMRLVMTMGSNEENALVAVHSFPDSTVALDFGADWVRTYTFQPKIGFTDRETIQLVALYREGRGLAWVFLLFNKPPITLDGRQLALRFKG